jgi:hypothetical protein
MSQKEILQKVAEGYLSTLVNDNADALIDLVGKNAIVEDPRFPDNKGEADLRKFVAEFQDWVRPISPRVEYLRTTVAQERVLCEDILHVGFNGEKWELPVGTVVADDRETGATKVHVYYTNWPFNKKHSFRRALFSEQQPNRAEFSGALLTYIQSLLTGDLERIREAWEADIYFREASGPPYTHWGKNSVVEYFKGLFSRGAPMLRDDTVNEGGRTVFMEFTVIGWNGKGWPVDKREAGLAVYERTSPDGLMCGIRIYDDVDFA